MSTEYLIGIDIGTQGTKAAIFSKEGEKIAESFEASKLISPQKGVVYQDCDDIYTSVLRTIADMIEKSGVSPKKVVGIGIDGQMAGILGIDKEYNAITYYDSWLDTRCEKYIKLMKDKAGKDVIRITGCPVTYAHGPKVLWWKHEMSDVYKKIDKFLVPSAYVAGKLAGLKSEDAYIDYTHLHFSGFGDVLRCEWSNYLLDMFDVDKNKMPKIIQPWTVIGNLTDDAAKECKLISGIPIVAGCGDSAATSLAAGVVKKGIIFDVAGTASVFSCCVDSFKPDLENETLLFPKSVIPGLWQPMAYINGGGMCLEWYRNNFLGDKNIKYSELDDEAKSIEPGSEGLIFLPHFSGRVCPNNPVVRGGFVGLTCAHKRAHRFRAIMESIAYEHNYYLKIIKTLMDDVQFSKVYAIGGGAKSKVFNSIKADVLGIDYTTPSIKDTAPLGSAIVAGYGVGVFDDMKKTVERLITFSDEIKFSPENHKIYKKYATAYETALNFLIPVFEKLI